MTQICRSCGCTNFSACPGGCWWVEDDLCSTCFAAVDVVTGDSRTEDELVGHWSPKAAGVEAGPERPPVRVADMDPLEALFCRALHDLDCGEQGLASGTPVDHELEAHEPWSGGDLDGDIPWPLYLAALRGRGLTIARVAT